MRHFTPEISLDISVDVRMMVEYIMDILQRAGSPSLWKILRRRFYGESWSAMGRLKF